MAKYRTREIVVEARQVMGEESIETEEDAIELVEGDWVLTTEEGKKYPMLNTTFRALFEPVEESNL